MAVAITVPTVQGPTPGSSASLRAASYGGSWAHSQSRAGCRASSTSGIARLRSMPSGWNHQDGRPARRSGAGGRRRPGNGPGAGSPSSTHRRRHCRCASCPVMRCSTIVGSSSWYRFEPAPTATSDGRVQGGGHRRRPTGLLDAGEPGVVAPEHARIRAASHPPPLPYELTSKVPRSRRSPLQRSAHRSRPDRGEGGLRGAYLTRRGHGRSNAASWWDRCGRGGKGASVAATFSDRVAGPERPAPVRGSRPQASGRRYQPRLVAPKHRRQRCTHARRRTSEPVPGVGATDAEPPGVAQRDDDRAWCRSLHGHLDEIAVDPDARVVILTGAGRGFCSGLDLGGYGAAPQHRPSRAAPSRDSPSRSTSPR